MKMKEYKLRMFCNCFVIITIVAVAVLPQTTIAQQPVVTRAFVVKDESKEENMEIGVDFYASQTNLMPYDGNQNDFITTLYGRLQDSQFVPLLRYVVTNYYYLNRGMTNNRIWSSEGRTAIGLGVDYKYNNYLKFRFILENINNKVPVTSYTQDSYGLIYNQYAEFELFELNSYLESFFIPRVSRKTVDTFIKVQALKSYYISCSAMASNVMFPFAQVKIKVNDDNNFGLSGRNLSVGPGYRYYTVNSNKDSFAFVAEIHSVLYQSKDLNGDWMQMQAAMQLWID